jgi:hypothetical protein
MSLLEQFVRRFAPRRRLHGELMIVSNGDPLFVAAFEALGWERAHPMTTSAPFVASTVADPERAVLPRPRGRSAS